MPRSLTNLYWITVGELRERERVITLLEHMQVTAENAGGSDDTYWALENAILLIKKGGNT